MSHTQCQQLVTIDSCCDPQQCPEPASVRHAATDALLCETHFGNGAKYAIDGTWVIGTLTVSMPDGWEPFGEPASAPAPALEAVTFDEVRPSGLVIERTVLESSGLVLGATPAATAERSTELVGRAGGEDQAMGDPADA